MIKNIVSSGCSFTYGQYTWPNFVKAALPAQQLYNVSAGAAGNEYIASSVVDCIQCQDLDPADTLVLVMWSGADRIDKLVSGEYWYLLSDYECKVKIDDRPDGYWIFSGGHCNAWLDHPETIKLFQPDYITADPHTFSKKSLQYIMALESFLVARGFRYRFMSFTNCWDPSQESAGQTNWSVAHFARDTAMMMQWDFSPWVFVNQRRDGIYELCCQRDLISDDDFHPSPEGQRVFAEEFLIPNIVEMLNENP